MIYSEALEKYEFLGFSEEQKTLILKFEKFHNSYLDRNSLSIWERWDWEEVYFSDILDDVQRDMYLNKVSLDKAVYVEELKLGDRNKEAAVVVAEEYLTDLKNNIKEWFINSLDLGFLKLFVANQHRITFLKEEYKRYLDSQRQDILLNHMRWNKAYCPNELKAALINNERSYVLPDYYSFKEKMGTDVKAVVEILEKRFQDFRPHPDVVDRVLVFMEHLLGPSVKTSYVSTELKADTYFVELRTSKVDKLMSVLLMDEEFYAG